MTTTTLLPVVKGPFASAKLPAMFGSKTVAVPAGGTVAVPPVKLTRQARKAIKAKGKIKAQASVSITPYSKHEVNVVNNGRL